MKITWDDCVYGCIGQIIAQDGRTRVIQVDYDAPGIATTFGWSLKDLQICSRKNCGKPLDTKDIDFDDENGIIECDCGWWNRRFCDHQHTDGTIDCKECKASASQFIVAAMNFLNENDGETADDPGYFDEN